jgi:hypothetical protein
MFTNHAGDLDRRRMAGYAAAFAALLGVTIALAALPSPARASENFCGQTLAPYGQSGDRCYGTMAYIFGTTVETYERAGCIDVADGSNNLLQSWSCGAAGSSPGPAAEILLANDGVRRKGVARNNNTSSSGYFGAGETCYSEC